MRCTHLVVLVVLLLLGLGLSSTASGYVITMFTKAGCKGDSKRINVYDNTCSVPRFTEAQSVRVEKYGGGDQYARFFKNANCELTQVHQGPWKAGRADYSFETGNCLEMGEGYTVKAFSSHST